MNRIPLFVLALFFISASTHAQSPAYSFDNFDTKNGVRVFVEASQPTPRVGSLRSRLKHLSRNSAGKNSPGITMDKPVSTVSPTALVYDSLAARPNNAGSALRGFTTGSAQTDSYLIDAGIRNGIDPLLLYSIMHQESSFKSHAISPKGARGLMQLMPGIEGGARYVRFLLDRFEGDVDLTLAGYNAGEGAVEKYGWRVPPYAETQEYVRRISRRYALLRDPNAALYAARVSSSEVARLQAKGSLPLTNYERTVLTVRLPDGRLQLTSQ